MNRPLLVGPLVLVLCGSLFLAPSAMAQAAILVEIGVYVASTAGIAALLAKLTQALASIYGNSAPLIDDQVCRSHKNSLQALVIDFRDVEANKKIFGRALNNVATQGSLTVNSWADLSGASVNVVAKLQKIQEEVNSQRALFAS
jgi:hypothetical protein